MSTNPPTQTASGNDVETSRPDIHRLVESVSRAFIGKEDAVTNAVLALVSGGHVLIEDVPGLGKTLLAEAIAKSLHADFKRIQFTADLLPSDVTGVTIFSQKPIISISGRTDLFECAAG